MWTNGLPPLLLLFGSQIPRPSPDWVVGEENPLRLAVVDSFHRVVDLVLDVVWVLRDRSNPDVDLHRAVPVVLSCLLRRSDAVLDWVVVLEMPVPQLSLYPRREPPTPPLTLSFEDDYTGQT